MSQKLTDEQIEQIATKNTMIVDIGYEHWAMSHRDAIELLAIFTRATKVENIHSSNYTKSIWISCEDQSPPVSGAKVESVQVTVDVTDPYSNATRAVS